MGALYIGCHIIVALAFFVLTASAAMQKTSVYLEFDSYRRNLEMVNGFGKGMFDKSTPENNLYVDYRLNQHFSVEAGQLFTQNYTRTSLSEVGATRFGQPVSQLEVSENKIGMDGTHLDLVGQFPLKESRVSLLGS